MMSLSHTALEGDAIGRVCTVVQSTVSDVVLKPSDSGPQLDGMFLTDLVQSDPISVVQTVGPCEPDSLVNRECDLLIISAITDNLPHGQFQVVYCAQDGTEIFKKTVTYGEKINSGHNYIAAI